MQKFFSLERFDENSVKMNMQHSKGLAPVICYEPWFPRSLESIKQCINDGYPVLVRLHSAASYPIQSQERYLIDLESHAVLIVGYDDDKEAVALLDPWNNNWGGALGGRRWLSYPMLQTLCVNSTCDKSACLTPLIVASSPKWDPSNNLSLDLQIGFYVPRGTVMDHDSWALTGIHINCILPSIWGGRNLDYNFDGHWLVGEHATLSLPIKCNPTSDGELGLTIKSTIQGKRPYEFEDVIETYEIINICIPQTIKKQDQFILSAS